VNGLRQLHVIGNYARRCVERNTKLLNKNDWNIIGRNIKTTDKLRPFIAKKIIMANLEKANDKIIDILIKNGISENKPFEIYALAQQIAERKENSGDLIKIADRYIELHDLKPQKVQITESRRTVDYDKLLPETKTQTVSTTINSENKQKEKD